MPSLLLLLLVLLKLMLRSKLLHQILLMMSILFLHGAVIAGFREAQIVVRNTL